MKKSKNGISLIVLVITIIVIIVLAAAVILNLSNNNPISNAKEAMSVNNKQAIIEEIKLKIMNKQAENLGKITQDEVEEIISEYGEVNEGFLRIADVQDIDIKEIWSDYKSIIRQSNNIVDVSKLQYGKRVVSGVVKDVDDFVSTEKIAIEPETKYISSRSIQNINYYDQNGEYLIHVNAVGGNTLNMRMDNSSRCVLYDCFL